MAKGKARTFGQDLMRGEHIVGKSAIPGGGTGPNSAYKFKTADGYKTLKETSAIEAGLSFGKMPNYDGSDRTITGTSIFDPVLCELAYRWFCPQGGTVLDPFAGGSVRGIVASVLGRQYVGVELRPEQVAANRAQAARICEENAPVWHVGDSRDIEQIAEGTQADFVFSCPPYADLEVYSDDARDLSTLGYAEFRSAYEKIIAATCALLKPDRFACFIVGDVRDAKGFYYGFPWHTIDAFEKAGLRLYNEAALVTAAGSLPIRAGKQFATTRKLGKTHQNILVFVKGDPRKATEAVGEVEFGEIDEAFENDVATAPLVRDQREDFTPAATPIEQYGDIWLKRDDLWMVAGVPGGKVRTCWHLAQGAQGLVTAGSRASPQVNIVAHIAQRLGVPCRAHVPSGALSPEVLSAQEAGAEIVQHKPGYNSVIVARARDDAAEHGWVEIPFGMECAEAVNQTRQQVRDFPVGVRRLVVPVGSGMSLAGILYGLKDQGITLPVLGVVVGAAPEKRLDKYAPADWREMVELVNAGIDYHTEVNASIGGVRLDPHYEAKCKPFLVSGDMLWIVGIRSTAL